MPWAAVIMWVHIMMAMFWVGGQLFLILVVVPVLRSELAETDRVRVASQAGRRFAVFSGWALALVIVTGSLNALNNGVSWTVLRDTAWGHVLVAKVVLVLAVLALSAFHGAYYGRRLEQLNARAAIDPEAAARMRALQRQSVRVSALNLLLNLVIVALAVWLTYL